MDDIKGGGPAWLGVQGEIPHSDETMLDMPLREGMVSPGRLEERLKAGKFAVVMEAKPAATADLFGFVTAFDPLREHIDTIQVTDNPLATPHIANIAPGAMLAQAGYDVMLNITCRDRNVIGQQAYLLAAAAMGMANIFCLAGDEPHWGTHPHATGVYDVNSFQWLALAKQMRDEGKLQSGDPIASPPKVFLTSVLLKRTNYNC